MATRTRNNPTTTRTPRLSVLAWNKGDRIVTPDDLRALPAPEPVGPKHKPVPHIDLFETGEAVSRDLGLKWTQPQLVLNKDGSRLFGGAIVEPTNRGLGATLRQSRPDGSAFALVFKSGNAGRVSITLAGGICPFICSNLDLHADAVVLKRKHTTGLRLEAELREGLERYVESTVDFLRIREEAATLSLRDDEAKLAIFDAFDAGLLAPRFFPHVVRNYFAPERAGILREEHGDEHPDLVRLVKDCGEDPATWTDCAPRNRLGLYSAFTRAVRELPAEAKLRATRNVASILVPGDPRLN